MELSRRNILGVTAGGLSVGLLAASANDSVRPTSLLIRAPGGNYAAGLGMLRDYALAELDAAGLPGMIISVVDSDGFSATMCVGWSEIETRAPVRPDHVFQIGSISKSFISFCIHGLADKGMVDLAAPVSEYLPDLPLPSDQISIQQLLDHTGGLPHDSAFFPRAPDGRIWTGIKPGTRMSYSNLGYNLLGLVIGKVTGRSHTDVLAEQILKPLGMVGAHSQIRTADRPLYATGYVPVCDDRPIMTHASIIPGPWSESVDAAGQIAATGDAMASYLRYVLSIGVGRGAPLMSDVMAKRLLAAPIPSSEFGPGALYTNGLGIVPLDGAQVLHHTGGMRLFASSFHADPVAGVACFASVNGRLPSSYRPRLTTAYGVRLMRAVRAGTTLPSPPDPLSLVMIDDPDKYAGHYVGPGNERIDLVRTASGLILAQDKTMGRLERVGSRSFATDHPKRFRYLLEFEKEDDTSRLWWGDALFGKGTARAQPKSPESLRNLSGIYVEGSNSQRHVVLARGNTLVVESIGEIVKRPGGFWSPVDDEHGVLRIWFDGWVEGRATRLIFNGSDSLRLE